MPLSLADLHAPDFARLTPAALESSILEALTAGAQAQTQLAAQTAPPTVDNTVVALERIVRPIQEANGLLQLAAFDSTPALVAVQEALAEPVTLFFTQLYQDPALWARLQTVLGQVDPTTLEPDTQALLAQTALKFRQSGAHLNPSERAEVQTHLAALAQLSVQMGKAVLAATQAPHFVDDAALLVGLSPERVADAKAWAEQLGHSGWAFHLDMPNVRDALEESRSPVFRAALWDAHQGRCWSGEHDTTEIIRETLQRRAKLARLLGFDTWAAFAVSDMMAQTEGQVEARLGSIWPATRARFEAEAQTLRARQEQEAPEESLTAADWLYWAAREREATYAFDANAMKAYFPREVVREGLFQVAERLFGVQFTAQPALSTYAEGVEPYLVHRGDTPVGLLYVDDFQRPTKRPGAWMEMARAQSRLDGEVVLPIVGNALNVAPVREGPVLLTVDEVLTAYHELGHGLHALLSQVRYPSQSGTQVPTDFVELPSQLLENWAMQPEVLALGTRHAADGSTLPAAMVAQWKAAAQFNQGFFQGEYLLSAYLDFRLHQVPEAALATLDLKAFTDQVREALGCPALLHPRYGLAHFTHPFESGYSARYYAYLWSEVLDADVFERFEQQGLFDPELADALTRHIYAAGHTRSAEASFAALMGRGPRPDALLRRRGILPPSPETALDEAVSASPRRRPKC